VTYSGEARHSPKASGSAHTADASAAAPQATAAFRQSTAPNFFADFFIEKDFIKEKLAKENLIEKDSIRESNSRAELQGTELVRAYFYFILFFIIPILSHSPLMAHSITVGSAIKFGVWNLKTLMLQEFLVAESLGKQHSQIQLGKRL
jgi:hypothetical protein